MKKLLVIALAVAVFLLTSCGASPTQPQTKTESTTPESRQTAVAGPPCSTPADCLRKRMAPQSAHPQARIRPPARSAAA